MTTLKGTIGRWEGAGLMATTLLGTGVFILPQMTIETAGSAALIAWITLTLAMIPIALVFGRLSSVLPHSAGPAYFVEKAFGQTAGRTIGLMFLLAVPIGTPAAILMTFQFVNSLVSISGWAQVATELVLLALLCLLNLRGIQVSAKLQFALTLAIVAVVVAMFGSVGVNLHETEAIAMHLDPQVGLVMAAMGIAFWSFLGIEAMTHLANDFKDPKRDMIPAMVLGTILVAVVYLGCTLLLLSVPSTTHVAMIGAFDKLVGGYGAQIIGVLGIASGLATVNVYTASVSRLVWSFSQEGVLPRYFSQLNESHVPARASTSILLLMGLVIVLAYISGQEIEHLISWTNGVFVIIYLLSMLSALKLLSKRYQPLVWVSCGVCVLIGVALGWGMTYSLVIFGGLYPLLWWQNKRSNNKALSVG